MRIESKVFSVGGLLEIHVFDIYIEESDGGDAYSHIRTAQEKFPGETIMIAGKGHMRVSKHVKKEWPNALALPKEWEEERDAKEKARAKLKRR